jgi:serine/threonine kinase 16
MILMLGVAKAMKSMHQYRVKSGATAVKKAKLGGEEGETARAAKKPSRRSSRREDDDDTEQEPLIDGEVTQSQEGVEEGDYRPYAHRDIKPGVYSRTLRQSMIRD